MREIKFQILWVKHNRDFSEEIKEHYTTLERLTNGSDSFPYCEVEIVAKRQYTGLKDKNGVEIYEGDLIKIKGDIDIYEIKWSEGAFCWKAECERDGGIVFLDELACSHNPRGFEFTLIGNIYQNPELLESNNDD